MVSKFKLYLWNLHNTAKICIKDKLEFYANYKIMPPGRKGLEDKKRGGEEIVEKRNIFIQKTILEEQGSDEGLTLDVHWK